MSDRILIVGLGLMGGSLGLALRTLVRGVTVGGFDLTAEVCERALALGAIDAIEPAGFPGLGSYNIIVVATPVRAIVPIIRQLAANAAPGTVFTDVGSTKSHMHREVESFLRDDLCYVGGHPMAGSEIEGLDGADAHLYENAVWILTDPAQRHEQPRARLAKLLEGIGALVVQMDPTQHDRIVAMTSHLPYLAAISLVNALIARFPVPADALGLAAGGFLDTTRVAGCPPAVFRDIVLTNKENISAGLDLMVEKLLAVKGALATDDAEALTEIFREARELRSSLPRFRPGFPIPFFELVVQAQDRPGFLGELATLLGQRKINIKDFVLMHVREGEPGTILLAFRGEQDLAEALRTLHDAGFSAHRR